MRTLVKKIGLSSLALLTLAACSKEEENQSFSQSTPSDIREISVPAQFNYQTARELEARIQVKGIEDQNLRGVKVSVFSQDPDFGGSLIGEAFTASNGLAEFPLRVPGYLNEVFVRVNSHGFANSALIALNGNSLQAQFGGSPAQRSNKGAVASLNVTPISGNFYYMGGFETGRDKGLPNYLEPQGDNLSQAFIDDINASLPEGRSVPLNNPSYLASNSQLDVVIDDKSDVWVTFVSEGAAYRNALGYFVYNTNNPPNRVQDIDSIFVVLPNASLDGSGGQLQAGDKVKIGTFEAGKSISWVLFQNAWTQQGVDVNARKWFSRSDLNQETDPSLNQHSVQLLDLGRQLLLNGFEDQTRSGGRSDNDFNDLIFYVTANPWKNVDITGIPKITPSVDTDGDGIPDETDDFPNDAERAIRNNYRGSLAFEDLWPAQGDYDFNDMVINYDNDHILNGNNQLVEIEADWTIRAVGASFANGFGFQFKNLPSAAIQSVSGSQYTENLINRAANGTENGQNLATVIAFDNVFKQMRPNGQFINTVPAQPSVAPVTISTNMLFSSPVSQNAVGLPPYNPFIFVNGDRSREVHLANQAPTALADLNRLGTVDDDSDASSERYYKTANNLPWALDVIEGFNYPIEYAPINEAYLNFNSWAESGGQQNQNWFLDLPGQLNTAKIY